MKTTKYISTLVAALLLCISAGASAATAPKPASFSTTGTVANAGHFSQTFFFRTSDPANGPGEQIYVSGLTSTFSSLSLDILTLGGTSISNVINGVAGKGTPFKASFSENAFGKTFAANTTYKAVVSGDASFAGVSFVLKGNYASLVPEPGEWALMLSGLGLVGIMARRRNASRST